MYPLIVSARDRHCQYFYDYLRMFVDVRCKCMEKIELLDVFNPDVSCIVFAHERDLREARRRFGRSDGAFPPVIAPESGLAAKSFFTGGASWYGNHFRLLELIKQNGHIETPPGETAENIFVFISRYPFRIGNVNSIAGYLSKQEYRRVREVFKNQFGLSMKKWLTIQKIKGILGKMRSRDEFGRYLSLAWECGFRSDAAFATFLRLHFGKNIRNIEEEAKKLKRIEIMEKIGSLGIL